MRDLTRRELVLAGAALAPVAQKAAGQGATTAEDWAKAARQANHDNADALAKVQLTNSVEPAFQFKA